jgi:hypothetical protein
VYCSAVFAIEDEKVGRRGTSNYELSIPRTLTKKDKSPVINIENEGMVSSIFDPFSKIYLHQNVS